MMEDGSAALNIETPAAVPLAIAKRTQFTRENAADMARRAGQARKRNEALRRQKAMQPAETTAAPDVFVAEQIASVRAQIKRLNVKLLTLHDSQKLNWIAAAVCKLVEQERVLSMRPEPPRLRSQGAAGRPTQRSPHSLANPVE